jgi:hypothetical protein
MLKFVKARTQAPKFGAGERLDYSRAKINWGDLQALFEKSEGGSGGHSGLKLRLKSVQGEYISALGRLRAEYGGIDNYIRAKLEAHRGQDLVITRNKYPYNLAPGIIHLVLWVNPLGPKVGQIGLPEIHQYLAGKIEGAQYILFKNEKAHQSVRSITHYQLFMKQSAYRKSKGLSIVKL